ncbi:TonB-dependent receptor plug domain-containing protein [Pelagicoccus enzymogenes]|uniref:TonB-dependent receptor plug domain-containing protein n=1 Tax=Pelagicoccus enzymogenes TaxID=2773457 RepID=UPI001CD63DFA|nr:TonB-dependent receptor plug domain-containing protein [Pelagicoccus enzymogenes]MDQ8200569.1 TonB-dependent receptor plug domain-containing protein [Pelagicoccus enzymogenes]
MKKQNLRSCTIMAFASTLLTLPMVGQDADGEEEEVFELSPFEVTANDREGYQAVDTLAGNRLNTKLRDVGNAISVVTTQFLEDTGATDNKSLLQYTTGTEVGGTQGTFAGTGDGALLDESSNFINPNQNTRVRGLTAADNTRDFFTSDIPWDGYNVERVELQRGPNSILFGQGSPAGLVNVGLKSAAYEDEGEVEVRFDQHNSIRLAFDINKVLIEDELAVRFSVLNNDEKYQQKPAYSLDKRIYAALRWDPAFLNGEGVRTTFKANFEDGKVESNNPRTLPPIDRITPWFDTGTYNGSYISNGNIIGPDGELIAVSKGDTRVYQALNRQTFNAHQLQQDNVQFPNHGQGRPGVNGGPYSGAFNPDYNPRLGSFADAFGGPINYFAVDGGSPQIWQQEIQGSRGIGPDGNIDGGIGGFDFNRSMGIATESDFAKNAGLPFGEFGVYKNNSITDPSIFDFYNNLIDGPNKEEWQNFNSLTMSFSQTYLSDMVGFDLSYNKQDYDNGQLSLLTGSQQALYIDMMGVFPDGNTDGWDPGEIPFDNGTPNPNVGRPFVSDKGQFGNNSYESLRESIRVTPFVKYDFDKGDGNWFTNILGSGTITGLYSEDSLDRENRNWQQYAIEDQGYIDFMNFANVNSFSSGDLAPSTVVYLGGSLKDASSAVGANIPGITQKVNLPRNSITRVFDSTWGNYPGVDPAAEWINNAYLPPELEYPDYDPSDPDAETLWPDRRLSTQAENPLNYVGWRDYPYTLTASEDSAANRERLTTRAALESSEVESQALIWQGHLINDSIVGTYGWRKDTVTSRSFSQDTNDHLDGGGFGYLDFDPSYYTLEGARENQLEVQSHSYSIVTHLDQLPFVSDLVDNLPFSVSLFYNNSSNFQPESARVDAYGESISAPAGETWDKGILVQSKDGRYSFKLNKFTTNVTNGTSTALSNIGFVGQSQDWGGNWANQFEYDMSIDNQSHVISHIAKNRPAGSPIPPNFSEDLLLPNVDIWNDGQGNDINGDPVDGGRGSLYNYGLAPGETAADAAAREANAIAAWRSWQASIDPRFYEAWKIDLNSPFRTTDATRISSTTPQNLAVTEDSTSQGYEMEFTMRPTENWNIMVNAAKTTAVRNNIGGAALNEFIAGYENALNNTAAGDIRVWWGGAGNETTLFQWNREIGSEWTSRKLQEGTNVPELREWRANLITNYDFTDGKFAGLSVGGGLRYQDSVIIGYTPVIDSDGKLGYDLANPYMGPSETNLDLWVGYGRELNDNLDWRIQLNVRNAFEGDGLIPITTQPDGTPAGYRIAPSETWSIRNTFSF